jgi:hypothetical protein
VNFFKYKLLINYYLFQSEHIYTTETLEYQLQNVLHFEDNELSGLIDWWRKSHSRIYGYYQLSAQAYFKFLQLCDNHQVNKSYILLFIRSLEFFKKVF